MTQPFITMIVPIQDDSGLTEPLLILPVARNLPGDPTQTLQELLALIAPQVSADSKSDEDAPAAGEITSQLRQLARNAQILQNARRVQCSAAREEMDKSEEAVQALLYEMEKTRAEIARCQQYKPSWQDSNLLPLAELLQGLPQETLDHLPTETAENYDNAMSVLRLEQEVAGLKRREDLLAALTKERDDLIKAKKDVKNRYEAVSVHIKDLYKSANAVSSKTRDVLKNATVLPHAI